MPSDDRAADLLRPLPVPTRLKATAWDAYWQSATAEELAERLRPLALPSSVKADLFDAKVARPGRAAGAPVSEPQPTSPTPGRDLIARVLETLGGLGVGVGKGAAGTGLDLTSLAAGALQLPQLAAASRRGQAAVAPATPPERAGATLEQLAELMVPLSLGGRLATVPSRASRLRRTLGGAGRMLGEGVELGAKVGVQTGGDVEAAVDAALLGAVSAPVASVAAGLGKGLTSTLPNRLYTQVFKRTREDMRAMFQAQVRGETNPLLAQEVMERGIRGSSTRMALLVGQRLETLERQVQTLVKTPGVEGLMNLPKKQEFLNVLNGIVQQFSRGFETEYATAAKGLRMRMRMTKGQIVKKSDALELKRFLDDLRSHSSFRLDPQLAPRQAELKTAADTVRRALRADRRFAELMDEERIMIEARDAIVDDAVRRDNRALLNLTDVLVGGGGLASGFPGPGLGAAAAIRGFQQPLTLTNIGSALHQARHLLPAVRPTIRGAAGSAATPSAPLVSP